MILYTTVPEEIIFQTDPSEFTKQRTIQYNGVPLLVEQEEQYYRIIRVLSSNPADYLSEGLMPGAYISMS
ncbi:YlzJ-like family protein [Heyndrickxia acidicola]|uniref:YlzJ-like family protein n=1 Tax=Heyndrickxia acidicola TaxID=209389 RepID=A0ABU6MBF9_9BACI|nr:YlzJ-like family protein [Heyndrickxia acidicola]MED1202015.1 YlzJ-like family protein [Heyndrickxia acidicola]